MGSVCMCLYVYLCVFVYNCLFWVHVLNYFFNYSSEWIDEKVNKDRTRKTCLRNDFTVFYQKTLNAILGKGKNESVGESQQKIFQQHQWRAFWGNNP